jgi:AcrR family transcriptional regulator
LTKRKLIDAVGKMIQTLGFNSIRIRKVAREAGVDRKLIYRYFGNLNNFIEAYIVENDFWLLFAENFNQLLKSQEREGGQAVITKALQEQFYHFLQDKKMQTLILLELSLSNH